MATKTSKTEKSITTEQTKESAFKEPTGFKDPYDIQIFGTAKSEYLYGNAGDNFIYGNGGGDTFVGDAGSDELHGSAADIDTVNYYKSAEGVKVNLAKGFGSGGDADGDSYHFINNIKGSAYRDYLYGDDAANVIDGLDGNDYLAGHGGDDTLIGGNGDDSLLGGTGKDVLNGGRGSDTASYADATSGVTIDLASGSADGTYAKGDTFISIENVTGSNHHDQLDGDGGDNVLRGGGDNDTLNGHEGDDTLYGDDGDDVLIAGGGLDVLYGGSGRDEVSYADETHDIYINLQDGYGGSYTPALLGISLTSSDKDVYDSIEDATGTDHDDIIVGSSGANRLNGLDGQDEFHGSGGADIIDGGDGTDTAIYWGSNSAIDVDLAAGTASGGHAQGDVLISIENLYGSDLDGNILRGSEVANRISSHGNFDVIETRGGEDRIFITGENVQVSAGAADDTVIVENAKNHTIDGNEGVDTLNFSLGSGWATEILTVDLELGTATLNRPSSGEQSSFTFENFENIVSFSIGSDHLLGDGSANLLQSHYGEDTLEGRGGDDTLIGGTGADHLDGGEGVDTVSYETSYYSVNVSLRAGSGFGADAQGDTIVNVENVIGGSGDDVLEGDEGDNELTGNGGSDILNGGGGSDILTGGDDADTFIFDLDYFADEHSTITDFEAGVDQIDLRGHEYVSNADQVLANLEQVDPDTVVFTYGQASITLENTQVANITADDFLFA